MTEPVTPSGAMQVLAEAGDLTPFWVAGVACTTDQAVTVVNPYDGSVAGRHAVPGPDDVERAVEAAVLVAPALAACSAMSRADALVHISARITERADEIARLITAENGKPLMWARAETARGAATFRWAAEEARRWSGEVQRLDTEPGGAGRMALIRRFPRGPVLGISPFNFPLNLVAHKIAPALAVGTPIVLKPAPATPLTALLLGELLAETDLPLGSWSILPVANVHAPALVADPRLPVVSFTGSDVVGRIIQDAVPRKHVTLELGGNAAVVVCDDWSSEADLDWAAERIAMFGMYQAGQSCISVQRVLIHSSLYDQLAPRIVAAAQALPVGSPYDETTVVGPLVNEAAAVRVADWIEAAVGSGAQILTGGARDGATLTPTVLANVAADTALWRSEVFGPVVSVAPFDTVDAAFEIVNDSDFGLQVGIFTHDVHVAFRAHRELHVGGVIIGDVPSFRAEQMPYGGVKDSGVGREGLHAAMLDYTEDRVLVFSGIDL